ncbi:MAG: helix-turn-helix transcriptional regulator [Desulfovibrio sp.]|nr:helix-turn-helix transcriptional regulator [Desulfovibrio sp.]
MKKNRTLAGLPSEVSEFLTGIGHDIKLARLRRNMTQENLAEAMFTTRRTLARLENGDPGISMGMFCTAVYCLGRFKELQGVLSPENDYEGNLLERMRTLSRRGGLKENDDGLDF